MPRGDRTGPMGMGPMSGRGLGYCAGYGTPGYVQGWGGFGRGRGRGFGRGMGRGWGFGRHHAAYFPAWGYGHPGFSRSFPTGEEVRGNLEAYRDELKRELAGIEEELEGQRKAKPES